MHPGSVLLNLDAKMRDQEGTHLIVTSSHCQSSEDGLMPWLTMGDHGPAWPVRPRSRNQDFGLVDLVHFLRKCIVRSKIANDQLMGG